MRAHVRSRSGLRLGLSLWLLAVLVVAGVAAQPGVSHAGVAAGQAQDDTVTYVVKPGDMLRDIAARYGTTMSAIVRANGLDNPDMIYPGQKLIIPVPGSGAAGSSTATPTPETTSTPAAAADGPSAGIIHTVALGDTLASIGATYGVGALDIAQANDISDPDLIWVGQRLLIPSASQAGSPTALPQPGSPTALPQPTATPVPAVTSVITATLTPQPPRRRSRRPSPSPPRLSRPRRRRWSSRRSTWCSPATTSARSPHVSARRSWRSSR